MRLFCLIVLLAVGGAVAAFAYQNQQDVTLTFFNYGVTTSVAAIVGIAYGLGMLSGWTVLGVLRRSLARVTEFPASREHAQTRG